MKVKLIKSGPLIFILLFISCQPNGKKNRQTKIDYQVPSHLSKDSTNYYLICHADTDAGNLKDGTELSKEGFEQAAFWGDYFSDKELDLFYTTKETFAFQTMIPIVHAYKGQVENIDKDFKFSRKFWQKTYGQNTLMVSHDIKNKKFADQLLRSDKYKLKDLDKETYILKLTIDEERYIQDTLIRF